MSVVVYRVPTGSVGARTKLRVPFNAVEGATAARGGPGKPGGHMTRGMKPGAGESSGQ